MRDSVPHVVTLIAVVGMHRSGTSIVSRMLSLLGASLGPESDLLPPKADNPKGFWESRSVVQLHDDLLALLGGRWDAPVFPDAGWERAPRLSELRARLEALVASHFGGPGNFVWKDPRGSLLLPLWREVTSIDHVVLVTRDPAEVISSLGGRNDIAPRRALRLWLRYVAEAHRAAPSPIVVAHEDLFDDIEGVAQRLVAQCELPSPTREVLDRIEDFVDPRLRSSGRVALDEPLFGVARGLHTALRSSSAQVARAFADLSYEYLRLGAEVEFVRDRLSRHVPD